MTSIHQLWYWHVAVCPGIKQSGAVVQMEYRSIGSYYHYHDTGILSGSAISSLLVAVTIPRRP